MSCCNDPDVDGNGLITTHAFDFTPLQHSQQCDLNLGRQVSNFVQKNCPAVCRFEPSEASLSCTGESALLVTEKLGRNQRLWDGSAIHADECPIHAIGSLVDAASYQLLSCTGFAKNQYGRIGRSKLSD